MKRNLLPAIIIMIFCLCATGAFSQFNPLTNSFTNMTDDKPVPQTQPANLISYSSLSGVPCTPNSFWAIGGAGVDLFTLSGNVITKVGTTVITGTFDPNLAYCNNLDGGTFGPTFYSTKDFKQPVYYDGTGVTASTTISPDYIMNCGGNGNFLYYIRYNASFKASAIVRYNGSALTPVYNFPDSVFIAVADIAVDSIGNVWFFTGPNNSVKYHADTLKVVSPGGQLLKKFPFPYDTDNGFGCFLLNGKLYLALGGSNTVHPNTILPIILTPNSATPGTPIPMPVTTVYSDMASCLTGTPFSINEHPALPGVTVYPNPFDDKLTISNTTGDFLEIILYDITTREILHQSFSGSVTLNTGQLPGGIYLYKITNKTGGEKTGKIVKK